MYMVSIAGAVDHGMYLHVCGHVLYFITTKIVHDLRIGIITGFGTCINRTNT